jgi:hypothetical protein
MEYYTMETNTTQQVERRSCFRVAYSQKRSPTVYINGFAYPVVDLSEKGVKILNVNKRRMPEDIFRFKMSFLDGETLDLVGKLQRISSNQIVLAILRGIPYQRILKEQTQRRIN